MIAKSFELKNIQELEKFIYLLEGLPLSQWYMGFANTLHLEFGTLHEVEIQGHLGLTKSYEGDYSLFLHGAWTIRFQDGEMKSNSPDIRKIDAFILGNELGHCVKVDFSYDKKIFLLCFSNNMIIDVQQEDDSWFVFSQYGRFSFSPKNERLVEYYKK